MQKLKGIITNYRLMSEVVQLNPMSRLLKCQILICPQSTAPQICKDWHQELCLEHQMAQYGGLHNGMVGEFTASKPIGCGAAAGGDYRRSEEHTSELQSRLDVVRRPV